MNFSLVSEFSKYVADLLKCKFLSKLYVFSFMAYLASTCTSSTVRILALGKAR